MRGCTSGWSKRRYVRKLKSGEIRNPTSIDKVHLRALEVMDDPLPYGIEPNRDVLEQLVAHARTQEIIKQPVEIDALFAAATRKIVG